MLEVALHFRRTLLGAWSCGRDRVVRSLTGVSSITILVLVEVGAFFGRSQFDMGNSG